MPCKAWHGRERTHGVLCHAKPPERDPRGSWERDMRRAFLGPSREAAHTLTSASWSPEACGKKCLFSWLPVCGQLGPQPWNVCSTVLSQLGWGHKRGLLGKSGRSPSASSAGYGERVSCHRLILGILMQALGEQVQEGCWQWADTVPNPCDRLQQQACYPRSWRAWRADLFCPRTHS